MKIYFLDKSKGKMSFMKRYFQGEKDVEFICEDLETFLANTPVECVVSPANSFGLMDGGKMYEVNLDIVCEKPNHKAILIGKSGKAIKEVSSFARQDMEKFLGRKVFLTTYVKVKEDWRNSAFLLKEHGYGDGNV